MRNTEKVISEVPQSSLAVIKQFPIHSQKKFRDGAFPTVPCLFLGFPKFVYPLAFCDGDESGEQNRRYEE